MMDFVLNMPDSPSVVAMLVRFMRREKTWWPCFGLASCLQQTGVEYIAYGALSISGAFCTKRWSFSTKIWSISTKIWSTLR